VLYAFIQTDRQSGMTNLVADFRNSLLYKPASMSRFRGSNLGLDFKIMGSIDWLHGYWPVQIKSKLWYSKFVRAEGFSTSNL